jgi:hypothetical protein
MITANRLARNNYLRFASFPPSMKNIVRIPALATHRNRISEKGKKTLECSKEYFGIATRGTFFPFD